MLSTHHFQVGEEAAEETKEEEETEPELPSFSKVSGLTLAELGLPPRMFTAGVSLSLCSPVVEELLS